MLHVHAEPELLEDPPLSLDHLVLQVDVGGVEDHRVDGPVVKELQYVMDVARV
jgi:hypothetical protein